MTVGIDAVEALRTGDVAATIRSERLVEDESVDSPRVELATQLVVRESSAAPGR